MDQQTQWITARLPELHGVLAMDHSFRSARVLVYHELYGVEVATLYADAEYKTWWREYEIGRIWQTESILGWLPLETLPSRPQVKAQWSTKETQATA